MEGELTNQLKSHGVTDCANIRECELGGEKSEAEGAGGISITEYPGR